MTSLRILAVALVALLFPVGCASTGGFGIVGFANVDGKGMVRTDGTVTVAMGNLKGDAGLRGKASGFLFTGPFAVDEGEVYVANRELDVETTQPVFEPLPAWAAVVFLPGEAEAMGLTFAPPTP